jgi:hypothetical protein
MPVSPLSIAPCVITFPEKNDFVRICQVRVAIHYANRMGWQLGFSQANEYVKQIAFHVGGNVEFMDDYIWYKQYFPNLRQVPYDDLYTDIDGSISINQNFLGD